jgi:hypothetical protein
MKAGYGTMTKSGSSAEEMFQRMKDLLAFGDGNDDSFQGPFEEGESCLVIGGLAIESKSGQVSLSGNLIITRDEEGLQLVRQLRGIVEEIYLLLDDDNINDVTPL